MIFGLAMLTGCSPAGTARSNPDSPAPTETVSPVATVSPQASPQAHVFVIVMENRGFDQAMAGSYTASLAADYGVATNYHGVSHPSLPNYLALTSGSTYGITDDGYHALDPGGIGAQLDAAHISWRAYMEGMGSNCFVNESGYALKHDPFPYYGNACPPQVVPFTSFDGDMSGTVPPFVWITPDLCHDGHDCSTAVADQWLSLTVEKIMSTSAWQSGGLLLITWDEGEDATNHVLTLAIHRGSPHRTSAAFHDHYSLLATVEDWLGLPRLANAASADVLYDLI